MLDQFAKKGVPMAFQPVGLLKINSQKYLWQNLTKNIDVAQVYSL